MSEQLVSPEMGHSHFPPTELDPAITGVAQVALGIEVVKRLYSAIESVPTNDKKH